jgi:hypothetical protein
MLAEDIKVREFLKKKLAHAAVSRAPTLQFLTEGVRPRLAEIHVRTGARIECDPHRPPPQMASDSLFAANCGQVSNSPRSPSRRDPPSALQPAHRAGIRVLGSTLRRVSR